MSRLAVLFVLIATAVATASAPDRGWSPGKPAARTAEATRGQRIEGLKLPRELMARIEGPTVLFYFSPTCPHCRDVAPEVAALAERLREFAPLLGVASGAANALQVQEFRNTFEVQWPIVHDSSRQIAAALGVRSTPSALLVVPSGPNKVDVRDAWYPYVAGTAPLVEGAARNDPFAAYEPGRYLGDRACGVCHFSEYTSHALTHHSIAWRTLEAKGAHTDPECTSCHVTGAGQPGGWDGDAKSRLVNVGCEACHGPSGPHDGERLDAKSTCTTCHDAKHSIAFSVEKGLPLIDHYLADSLDDAGFRERRMALLKGELPRDLLAFPDGENLRSEACASCHPAQVAQWKSSPHAAAMQRLEAGKGREDVGCVSCHATPLRSGVRPTELSGFHLDEGVSCASCHGPADAHVAAGGGRDNIEGLGEDCPVCVIETVCTSCHTPAWDPDWDLERDLPRVHHSP